MAKDLAYSMNSGVNSHPSMRIDSPVTKTTQLRLEYEKETHKNMYVDRKAKAATSAVINDVPCHILRMNSPYAASGRKSEMLILLQA